MLTQRRFLLASLGSVASVAILAVWLPSRWFNYGYEYWPGAPEEGYYFVRFDKGFIRLCHGHHSSMNSRSAFCCEEQYEYEWRWSPAIKRSVHRLHYSVRVALWVPFVLVAIPTAILWCPIRRRPPPHCCQHCGYDLTGNVSGICPECGAEVARIGQEDSSGPATS